MRRLGLALRSEKLLAESTGKEGKGIVPVEGELPGPPETYGTDRILQGAPLELMLSIFRAMLPERYESKRKLAAKFSAALSQVWASRSMPPRL